MSVKKRRKSRGGQRHFDRAKKRNAYIKSQGMKNAPVVLIDDTLTKRSKYFQEGEIQCRGMDRNIEIGECMGRQEKGKCKDVVCYNKVNRER